MKTLKTLGLLLLMATGLIAQPTSNDFHITGYVTDNNGMAVTNHDVCVGFASNNPALPSDTICVTTNANGYYDLLVVNGSVTGPNVTYEVFTYDPCALVPHVQTRQNYQGTIDTANVNFQICAVNPGCSASFSFTVDTVASGLYVYTFEASGTGQAPLFYEWWIDGSTYTSQTVTHTFQGGTVGVYLTVTGADSCQAFTGDTLYLDGNPNQGCSANIVMLDDSMNAVLNAELTAIATGVAPFTYAWSTGETTETIYLEDIIGLDTICVEITDANGCTYTMCEVVGFEPTPDCSVEIQVTTSSNPNVLADFTAIPTGVAPFYYTWSTGGVGQVEPVFGPGTYCVNIEDATGCESAVVCETIPCNGVTPDLNLFTTVDTAAAGTVYILEANGAYPAYQWSTGEQTQLIEIVNPSPNGEVICVTVTDSWGCTETTCDTLFPINNLNCNADFITSANPNSVIEAGDTLAVTYTGSQSQYNYYFWTVQGNGMFMNSYEQDPMFVLPSAGTYEVCLTVTDSITSCASSHCETVVVQGGTPGGCQAYFTWYEDSLLGNPQPAVAFNDGSQNAAYWFWDFGDNTTSTDQNPLHVYNAAGTYGVCLTIVNADQSCQQTYCDTVVVGNSGGGNCSAAFSNSGPTPIGYTFSANVQNSDLYYYWTIDNQYVGDGFEAYAPGLTNGVHNVCLTIIDSLAGCSDTQCQTITVGSPNCFGYISGQLYAGSNNQPLDEGVVYLITYDTLSGQLTAVDSMVVDSGNYYFFGPLACGDYIIKAAAYPGSQYYSNHVPTYYGTSPFWGFAQTVTIGQVNVQVTADIFLIAANNPGGPGFIGGNVNQGANKVDPGDPLEGMQVILFDMSGNAIAYTYTDANGEFGFNNLAYGSYQVYVEKLSVETVPAFVTIGPNEPSVDDITILVSESLITTGINEVDFEGAISEVYPNPVTADASISFNFETGIMVNISILDLTGRTISTFTEAIGSGDNQVRFETEGLTKGYYFLNVQDEEANFSVTRKFMRVD